MLIYSYDGGVGEDSSGRVAKPNPRLLPVALPLTKT